MRFLVVAGATAVLLCGAGPVWAQELTPEQIRKALLGGPDSTAGIQAAKQKPPAAAVPNAAKVARPPDQPPERPSVNLHVQFATGAADLTPTAMRTLDALGQVLSSRDFLASRYRVEGHTDTVGSATMNQTLSERRAQAVVAYLEEKFGISADRLQAVGMGERDLAVPTGDQVPEYRNRRVQVVNIGP